MKNVFSLLLTLFVITNTIGQDIIGEYENFPKENIDGFGQLNNPKVNRILLKKDKTFEFGVYPLLSSCWTWSEYNGTWERKNDTILLHDNYKVIERGAKLSFEQKPAIEFYSLYFKTDKNTILNEKNIKIRLVYDFDADLDNVKLEMKLDNKFMLRIPFKDIPNLDRLASFGFEYSLPNGEKRFGHITESNTINEKEQELKNSITITLIENPKEEMIYRTTKSIMVDKKLKILSTQKTKPNILDYTTELIFEEFYEK